MNSSVKVPWSNTVRSRYPAMIQPKLWDPGPRPFRQFFRPVGGTAFDRCRKRNRFGNTLNRQATSPFTYQNYMYDCDLVAFLNSWLEINGSKCLNSIRSK